jgi:hypothetical protein
VSKVAQFLPTEACAVPNIWSFFLVKPLMFHSGTSASSVLHLQLATLANLTSTTPSSTATEPARVLAKHWIPSLSTRQTSKASHGRAPSLRINRIFACLKLLIALVGTTLSWELSPVVGMCVTSIMAFWGGLSLTMAKIAFEQRRHRSMDLWILGSG